ncbi:MAG: hypothetical protein WC533_04930 [Candidatus Pacearchaeota archaeon]
MNEKYSEDIGEQIISKLKELTLILEKIKQERDNDKKRPHSSSCGNRVS